MKKKPTKSITNRRYATSSVKPNALGAFPSSGTAILTDFMKNIPKFPKITKNIEKTRFQKFQNNTPKTLYPNGWNELGPLIIDSLTGHYSVGLGRIEDFYVNPILSSVLSPQPTGHYHTNFKLESEGEQLILSNQIGMVVDSISFPNKR